MRKELISLTKGEKKKKETKCEKNKEHKVKW